MSDQSGETVLYDKVALRFKGGFFSLFLLRRTNRRPVYSNHRQPSASKAPGGTLCNCLVDCRTPNLSTWTTTLKSPISRFPVSHLPCLHSRHPHSAQRHLESPPQRGRSPADRKQRRNRAGSERKLVDICVNLGIRPQIHYQNSYPCDHIADLFYQSVGSGGIFHE